MADETKKASTTEIPEFDFDFTEDAASVVEDITDTPPVVQPEDKPAETPPETPPATPTNETPPTTPLATPPVTPPVVEEEEEEEEEEVPEGADPMAYGIYKTMVDRGYWNENEEFKGTIEEVDELFEKLPDAVFEGLMTTMPEPLKNLLQFGYAKGETLTNTDLATFFTDHKPITDTVDLETADGRRAYLKTSLVNAGTDAEEAEDLIDLWEDKGKLEERANARKTADDKAKADAAKAATEAAATETQQRKAAQKKFVTDIQKNVQETEWKPKTQRLVLREITEGHLNRKSKIISNYPKALVQLANYLRYFDETSGQIDESAFKAQSFTTAAKDVKSTIEKHFSSVPQSKARKVKRADKNETQEFEFAD